MIKRIAYLFYYVKELDRKKLDRFLHFASRRSGRSRIALLVDAVSSALKYNISILDYFYFRFFEQTPKQRLQWAGTGYMYEYQLEMNSIDSRKVLADKIEFMRSLRSLTGRQFNTYDELANDGTQLAQWLRDKQRKLVVKNSMGQVGAEVKVIEASEFDEETLLTFMRENRFNMIEEYVLQHPRLMQLSSTALNTVRIITQKHNDRVTLLAARLRISVNSQVDNMAAGNMAAPVDIETGIVNGPGVYSDITKQPDQRHPVTGVNIIGFEIPFWQETCDLARCAALNIGANRSVGWDIAITEKGPLLIEGNHNWCKLLWQLPVSKGLRHELEIFKNG